MARKPDNKKQMLHMENSTSTRQTAIRQKQTALLFKGMTYSTIGTFVTALAVVLIIAPKSDQQMAWFWFSAVVLVSAYRWLVNFFYSGLHSNSTFSHRWCLHFNLGAYLAALSWASIMWLLYPIGYPAYQVLTILSLSGVAGGALATLSYDRQVITLYQGILLVGIESRLFWEGDRFSLELGLLSFLYFGFLMRGGREIGSNYYELLALRQDSEDNSLELLKTTEKIARIGYWKWDMKSSLAELSDNLVAMCGFSQCHVEINRCLDLVHADDRRRVEMAIESCSATGREVTLEYRMQDPDKTDYLIMNQVIKRVSDSRGRDYLLGTIQDISAIKSAEQKIYDMAYFDELTGLANRSHFLEYLKQRVKSAARKNQRFAVLYVDLDDFKEINDTLGHERGDQYLNSFARHMKGRLRDADFLARLGGDEFCIVLDDLQKGLEAKHTTQRCLELMQQVIEIEAHRIQPKMSIGIAVFPEDGADPQSLLKAADAAMYAVKHGGKQGYAFYDSQMTTDASIRLQLETDLRQAMENKEFELWYQPKISLRTGRVTGVEALIRWQHPERGMVRPDLFIEAAERIGLINEIGEWVLETACRQQQIWKGQGVALEMAVNISSSHFTSDGFPAFVTQVVQANQLHRNELEVEITESMSRDPVEHARICHQLRGKGIRVAIDDFGTGYSSLSVLKQLEVDTLKVDRSFINQITDDEASALMVRTIIDMSAGLGYSIVAEGVETLEQVNILQELGCPYVQGFYFSKPVEGRDIPELAQKVWSKTASPETA